MSEVPQSLESIGGVRRVAQFVDEAFQRVYADEDLKPIFRDAGDDRVNRMKTQIVAVMTDATVQYTGTELTDIHHGRGIQEQHYSRLMRHIIDLMEERGVAKELVDQFLARLALYSNRITGASNVDG